MSQEFERYFKQLDLMSRVSKSARDRSKEASSVLKRSADYVLGGKRSGRQYKVPGSRRKYTASAKGEAPGQRTRKFRRSWYSDPRGTNPGIDTQESDIARMMTKGTKRFAWAKVKKTRRFLRKAVVSGGPVYTQRRPFVRRIKQRSNRSLSRIYKRPYLANTQVRKSKWVMR